MFIPGPSFAPLVDVPNIDTAFQAFELAGSITGGVAVFGSAAAYALVWELGPRPERGITPGPKTTWGINRNGDRVVLTKQAPRGYVGINESKLWPILREHLSAITFAANDNAEMLKLRLSVAVDNAMQDFARIISESAPVDSGDLRSQIQHVDSLYSESSASASFESDTVLVI